jgi:pimeloyl-ACP methyl ester carboxylesterase
MGVPLPPFLRRNAPGPVRHTFGAGRHKLLYQTHGGPAGTSILLVHGLSGSGRWWKHNIDALRAHHPVHVIELVGYGGNRAFRPARLTEAAESLAHFIALLPEGRAHVIGHSMGGQIASMLAAKFPERVDRLVLAAAAGLVRSNIVRMALNLPVAAHYSPLDFLPTLAGDALRAGPVNLLLSTLDILGADTTGVVSQIKSPTLLIWGDKDNLVPVAAGEAMHKLIPGSRLEVLEGAGHVLMWDRAKTFNRLVLDFLTTTSATSTTAAEAPPADG